MGVTLKDIEELKEKTRQIRNRTLMMTTKAGSGHLTSSYSMAELLVALYYRQLKQDPKNPTWPDRDRCVLSKGHGCPILYAILADLGYFPQEELNTLRKINSSIQGHPELTKTPGIEFSSGSLGQGLSFANGIALAAKIDKKDYRVYSILGDGEMQEGQIWEALMTAAQYGLSKVTAILDFNLVQQTGFISDVMGLEPLADKIKSFGWHVISINGFDFKQILSALDEAESVDKPVFIIARTYKGGWHGQAVVKDSFYNAVLEMSHE